MLRGFCSRCGPHSGPRRARDRLPLPITRYLVRRRLIGVVVSLGLFGSYLLYNGRGDRPGNVASDPTPHSGGVLTASIRTPPSTFNPLLSREPAVETVARLTQGGLVRVNRATFDLEPWLAERWESAADGRVHTLHLRAGVAWSDGRPFTSADVVFTLNAVSDPATRSVFRDALLVSGQPIAVSAPDAATIVLTLPSASGPGLHVLDGLPILPAHAFDGTRTAGGLAAAWSADVAPSDVVGSGPYVLRESASGRLVFDRNPRYWRRLPNEPPLPYLDRLVLEVVSDPDQALSRLHSGAIDVMDAPLRPQDYVAVRRMEEEGKVVRVEQGVSLEADALWFCLKADARSRDRRFGFVSRPEFRQAISHAIDREAFAQDAFFGDAVPVWGPITPGNRAWFSPNLRRYPFSRTRAAELLRGIGLVDRTGNGVVEDPAGVEARFVVLTEQGSDGAATRALREQAATVGIALEMRAVEQPVLFERLRTCQFDAVYARVSVPELDPARNPSFWLSSGSAHPWNPSQRTPATEWEAQIDRLMLDLGRDVDPVRRRALFNDVQRIFAENLPMLFFAAPRVYAAHSARVAGVVPSVLHPPILWSADTLFVR